MNTARATFRVGFFGTYWQVTCGDETIVIKSVRELVAMLSCKPYEHEAPAVPKPTPTIESVEEFLARGGEIQRFVRTAVAPLPPAVPEKVKLAPSRITLESLFGNKTP